MSRQMFSTVAGVIFACATLSLGGATASAQEADGPGPSAAQRAFSETNAMLDTVEAEFRELICTRAADLDFAGRETAINLALNQNYVDPRFDLIVRKVIGEAAKPDHWNIDQIILAEKMLPLCTLDAKERTELVFRCYLQTARSPEEYNLHKKLRANLRRFPDETSRLVAEQFEKGENLDHLFSIVAIIGKSSKKVLPQLMALAASEDPSVSSSAMLVIPGLIQSLRDREQAAMELANRKARGIENIEPKMIQYAERIIGRYDSNNDGVLTESEWGKMLTSPAAADLDGDQSITVAEYAAWMQSRSRR